ncbi:MAG: formamidopyrimidine/5-formyluracil/ 5-hydroxymethyluracil DNA glycosylase [Candidatus Woesebacteria bacterium GW2011_GWB1_39_10]|nr:MAG: formamidopyrimidine/5-formyluracil/ 5-hydroxymethyluracil DNA glycosylase [Candidatus Woesebacteria bacterium GW2011_GWB1_39_10]KKR92260.1 MAG: formamidopyrimidine/5-formyluracil/ 5-hydroxymethyluracil DNA glycosylase [Candidatus Woesebacteria bacterium GW2011_GWA1_41_13b]
MKLQLAKFLVGHKILGVEIRNPKYEIRKDIIGGKITGIRRFGKVSVIDLDNGYSILTHVKLTGQYIYRGPNLPKPYTLSAKVIGGIPGPHTLVIFKLDHDGVLYYNDVRRFGWIKIVDSGQVIADRFIDKLGPEPFGKPQGKPSLLTLDLFKQILSKTSRPIKIVLMDQTKVGGVGNIYANDALWLAKINPKRKANSVEGKEAKELYEAILTVLREGLKYGGASELAFVTPDGKEGKYQNHTLAYGHEGELCGRCHKAKFIKYFLGGRGTYVCPNCQK